MSQKWAKPNFGAQFPCGACGMAWIGATGSGITPEYGLNCGGMFKFLGSACAKLPIGAWVCAGALKSAGKSGRSSKSRPSREPSSELVSSTESSSEESSSEESSSKAAGEGAYSYIMESATASS